MIGDAACVRIDRFPDKSGIQHAHHSQRVTVHDGLAAVFLIEFADFSEGFRDKSARFIQRFQLHKLLVRPLRVAVAHIQSDHGDRQPGIEHDLKGFGVGINIEFRNRRSVARSESCRSHRPDTLDFFHLVRRFFDRFGDIGGRSERDNLHLIRIVLDRVDDKVHRAAFLRLLFRVDQTGVAHTVVAEYAVSIF